MLRVHSLVVFIALSTGCLWAGPASPRSRPSANKPAKLDQAAYEMSVVPFLSQHCAMCHNDKAKVGGLDITAFHTPEEMLEKRDVFERILARVKGGEMPPKGTKSPSADEINRFSDWFTTEWARIDRNLKPDPGRVTARRLNRFEYNNTIHDLLGIDFTPADDFPADDSGYGFDNIGDVLSLSPVLMEKYLAAAEKIAKVAIVADPPPKPSREKFAVDKQGKREPFVVKYKFPTEADYQLRAAVAGFRNPIFLTLSMDGEEFKTETITTEQDKPRLLELTRHVMPGEHTLVAVVKDDPSRPTPPVKNTNNGFPPPPAYADSVEIQGPYDPKPLPLTDFHKRLFVCTDKTPECAKTILAPFMRRAWRRPVTPQEVAKQEQFVEMALKDGQSFEQAMRVAVEAVLVSPYFLFRIERDPAASPAANGIHRISDYELASRLSYFLWSSLPDDRLLQLADRKILHQPAVLSQQVNRMLRDPKSARFTENFAGQWLELRNLDSIKPDPDKFPQFDPELRAAMKKETTLFFEHVLTDNRPITDFIDGKYSYLNERLAKHYGIEGVTGDEFRRVELDGSQRSGVLTQASVLTVSSYPTRTSPVIRGKWILENFLNAPPPPPPPNVPALDDSTVGTTGSMRQQLEKHRASPVCASCHSKMDPLGFGLENYDAIGRWRTKDGNFPADASGTLPDGKSFNGPAEMKNILDGDKDAFAGCLTEKAMTYALGRGLERYDKPTISKTTKDLSLHQYRFSRLVWDIVNSMPFQMRRGVAGDSQIDTQMSASTQLP